MEKSLDSLLLSIKDSEVPVEIIVNDDCSTNPQTQQYLLHCLFSKKISSLILNNGINQGVGESLRKCFGTSQGDLVIKADVDLIYRKGWLDEAVKIMETFDNISNLGGFHYDYDPVDYRKMYIQTLQDDIRVPSVKVEIHKDSVGSLMVMPRKLLEEHPWSTHSEAFAEDFVWKREMEKLGYLCALPVTDFCYNIGFGLGNSTVAVPDNTKQSGIGTQTISKEPFTVG